MSKNLSFVDIFAGCGGLSLGLCNAEWHCLFAIEQNAMAFQTLSHNLIHKKSHFSWPKWLPKTNHDIDDIIASYKKNLRSLRGRIGLVAGGPPCQGFSSAGRRRESDKRNMLIHSYIEFVDLVRPKVVFFENVKGFTMRFQKGGRTGKPYSQVVLKGLKEIGYSDVEGHLIDFAEFGVPQRRKRFIIVGTQRGVAPIFFELIWKNRNKFLLNKGLRTKIGVMTAISDLQRSRGEIDSPDSQGFKAGTYSAPRNNYQRFLRKSIRNKKSPDSHRFVNHNNSTCEIFKNILKNVTPNVKISEEEKLRFGLKKRNTLVLGQTDRAPTLMSIPDDYIHYSEPRILTVREYARIQSFPDWFEFKGAYTTGGKRRANTVPRYTQIGNAIPPLFAELAGEVLKEILIDGKTRSN